MNMPNVFLHSNGSESFVVLRPHTGWALKCSTLPMVLSLQMVSTKINGSAATNVNTLTTWTVLHMKKKQNSTSPLSTPSMNVENSKRVTSPLKQVIFPFSVAKQTTTKKKRLGKDGRGCLVIEEVAGGGRLQEARGSPKFSQQVSKRVILTKLQVGM